MGSLVIQFYKDQCNIRMFYQALEIIHSLSSYGLETIKNTLYIQVIIDILSSQIPLWMKLMDHI